MKHVLPPCHSIQKSCSFRDNWTKIPPPSPLRLSLDSVTVHAVTVTVYIGIWCTDFFKAIFVSYPMPAKTGGRTCKCTMPLQPLCTIPLCSTPVLFCVETLTTVHYCAIMMFSQFNLHLNIAVIVSELQSGWLRNHCPVLARNKKILLQNVLTGSGAHPASYWAPHALSLGLKLPGHEADSPTPSRAIT